MAQVSEECVGAALRRMAPPALPATLESWLEGEMEEQRQQAALQQDTGGSTSSSGDILPAVRGGLCGCLSESRPATEQAGWHEHARCLHADLQEWQLMASHCCPE